MDLLNWILFANRIIVYEFIEFILFYIVYKREVILLIEIKYST